MVDIEELRQMNQLDHLTDDMLKRIRAITEIQKFRAGDYIYKEGDYADSVYAIIEGKVNLDIVKNGSAKITINRFGRSRTLGLSALLDTEQRKTISDARAVEDTKVFVWKSADLEKLFFEDYELGFLFIKRAASIIKKRLLIKNAQLVSSLLTEEF